MLLFLLKEFGKLESQFVLDTMTQIQIVGVAYMGVQTVSDIIREYRNN